MQATTKELKTGSLQLTVVLDREDLAPYISQAEKDLASQIQVDGFRPGKVPVEEVKVGNIIKIRPGDMIPLDGIVTNGESSIDEASITGESIPKEKYIGEIVYAGTLNQNGYLEVKVTKIAANSTLSKIVTLIQGAQKSRPEMQEFLDQAIIADLRAYASQNN